MKSKFIIKYYLISILILIILGCTNNIYHKRNNSDFLHKKNNEIYTQPVNNRKVMTSLFPKIRIINWHHILFPMIINMQSVNFVDSNNSIWIDSIQNNKITNLQIYKANVILSNLIVQLIKKLHVINLSHINFTRQKLGLSLNDKLESLDKTIGLARYLNAKYLLYSNIQGTEEHPVIELQLILVQTGEIIWSKKNILSN